MKKLFTFLMVLAMTSVVFGQLRPIQESTRINASAPQDSRSTWMGSTEIESLHVIEPGEMALVRLNSYGTLNAGNIIEKVKFYWIPEYQSRDENNNVVTVTSETEYKVVIYTGGNISWLGTPVTATSDVQGTTTYTTDEANMGTLVREQTVSCVETSDNYQEVTLSNPYTVTGNEGEIWIGLVNMGDLDAPFGMAMANPGEDWGQSLNRYPYTSPTTQETFEVLEIPLYYANTAHTLVNTAKYQILAYVNDGGVFTPQSDWMAEIYDPDDEDEYPEAINWLQIASYDEAINFYGGFYNYGPDNAYGLYFVELYAQVEGGEPVYFISENWLDTASTVEMFRGWRPQGQLVTTDSLEFYGLSYPFQVCLSVTYTSDPSYHGIDPNTSNNTACITVSDQPEPEGINENTNALNVTPNPASTTLTVANAAGAQISVYNIAGQEVMSVANAEANETLNVSNLNAGLYIVRVVNGNEVSTAKVSIVR